MLATFLYLYFRDRGREISWREFVNFYLARGLVRDDSLFKEFTENVKDFKLIDMLQEYILERNPSHSFFYIKKMYSAKNIGTPEHI